MSEIKKSSHKNAIRSRHMIKKAFAELMNEKDIQKITVTDIVERANVSRGTFYAHYLDVYDLCGSIQNNVLMAIEATIEEMGIGSIIADPYMATLYGMTFLAENKSYFKLFVTSSISGSLLDRASNLIEAHFSEYIKDSFSPEQQIEMAFFLTYTLGAYKNIILCWLMDKDGISAEKCAEMLSEICKKSRPDFISQK